MTVSDIRHSRATGYRNYHFILNATSLKVILHTPIFITSESFEFHLHGFADLFSKNICWLNTFPFQNINNHNILTASFSTDLVSPNVWIFFQITLTFVAAIIFVTSSFHTIRVCLYNRKCSCLYVYFIHLDCFTSSLLDLLEYNVICTTNCDAQFN